jgi:hypothetical protein
MHRLSTALLTVLALFVTTLLAAPMLAQAPVGSANFEAGNQALISSHDRVEIQEKLLYAYAYTFDSKDCVSWSKLFPTDAVLDLRSAGKLIGRDAILEFCIAQERCGEY